MLGVPGQYKSVALMLSHKMDSIVVPIGTAFANPVTYAKCDISVNFPTVMQSHIINTCKSVSNSDKCTLIQPVTV